MFREVPFNHFKFEYIRKEDKCLHVMKNLCVKGDECHFP